jgi:hypothetical protein
MKTTSQILHEIETTSNDIVCADHVRSNSPWHKVKRPSDRRTIYVIGIMTSLYDIDTPPSR